MYQYFVDSLREFSHIRWLSFRRALLLTVVVVLVGILAGFLLGSLDSGFSALLAGVII